MDQVSWWRALTQQISQARQNNANNNNKPVTAVHPTSTHKPPAAPLARVNYTTAAATSGGFSNAVKVAEQRGVSGLKHSIAPNRS